MTHPPQPHTRRCLRLLLAGLAAASLLCAAAPGAGAAAAVPRAQAKTQQLAVILSGRRVYRQPAAGSLLISTISPERPITGERTALPVVGSLTVAGVRWLKVMLPGRPNSSTGWIAQQGTRLAITPWRIRVSLGHRHITVYHDGTIVRSFSAVVGKPETPTPTGSFFVEETLQMRSGEPGGPFALALSARSNALQEFEGGPGQIAIHGRDNLGGILGNAESHGCVRIGTANIDWLAFRIGPGVPVAIVN
jgi:lipoprotein-anchoring transpeptidase ErfK/SrfK